VVIRVPHQRLTPDALRRVIEEYVLREGTDYGERPVSLDRKVADVHRELSAGTAVLLFDTVLERTHIAPADRFGE
jgi:uncharacterized protein YheU (UPF0270 family)